MGEVADRLSAMTIVTTSPDGAIIARVKAKHPDSVEFRTGAYPRYKKSDLEYQLAALARMSFTRYQKDVGRIMEDAGLDVPLDPRRARNIGQRDYLRALATLKVIGPRRDRLVVFGVNGTANFRCRLAPETLDDLDESAFVAACLTGAREFMSFFEFEKRVLRTKLTSGKEPNLTGVRRWWDA